MNDNIKKDIEKIIETAKLSIKMKDERGFRFSMFSIYTLIDKISEGIKYMKGEMFDLEKEKDCQEAYQHLEEVENFFHELCL